MKHVCKLNSTTETVTVALIAHGLINADGKFGIFDSTGKQLEAWPAQISSNGKFDHVVTTATAKLPGCTMTWDIAVCSMKEEVTTGSIEITVMQKSPCVIDTPIEDGFTDLGQCSEGDDEEAKGQLTFTI